MKKSIVASLAVGVLVLAACGSDSGGSSGPQGEAADAAIAAASEEGMTLDEECVNDVASQLSDEDAEAIVAAGPDGDPDVSDEGTAIGAQLLGCADSSDIADAFIEEIKASGQEFDEACVREGLDDLDLSTLAGDAQSGEAPEELIKAVFDCFEVGG
jgi:hypothetical protein